MSTKKPACHFSRQLFRLLRPIWLLNAIWNIKCKLKLYKKIYHRRVTWCYRNISVISLVVAVHRHRHFFLQAKWCDVTSGCREIIFTNLFDKYKHECVLLYDISLLLNLWYYKIYSFICTIEEGDKITTFAVSFARFSKKRRGSKGTLATNSIYNFMQKNKKYWFGYSKIFQMFVKLEHLIYFLLYTRKSDTKGQWPAGHFFF